MKNVVFSSPRALLIAVVLVAVAVAALLVVLSRIGGGGASGQDAAKLYAGIPQKGATLGRSDAPVTVVLYEDFQCPFCGQFSRDTFPDLVSGPVKDGKVKVVSETLAFLGPDSVKTARAAKAAGDQNLYWPYYSLLFENQGQENSGYATDGFLKDLAEKTPKLDVGKWDEQRAGNSADRDLEAAQSSAQAAGVDSTPTLVVRGPDGEKKLVGMQSYGEVQKAIDSVDGR